MLRFALFSILIPLVMCPTAAPADPTGSPPPASSAPWAFTGPTFDAVVAGQSRTWALVSDAPREKLVRNDASGRPITYYGARAKSNKGEVVFVTCQHEAMAIQQGDKFDPTTIPCKGTIMTTAVIDSSFAANALNASKISNAALSKSTTAARSLGEKR